MRKPINRKAGRAWLVALLLAGAGCTDDAAPTQVISGKVTTNGAVAVRAVRGDVVVTASQIRTDGSFTLVLPAAGERYRLEVLTTSGVRHVFSRAEGSLADLSFRVCQPTDPYDLGGLGPNAGTGTGGSGGGMGGDPGVPEPWECDPDDPMCVPPPPPMCAPDDPSCEGPTQPGCTDPSDPYCFCTSDGDCPPPTCGGTEPWPGEPNDPTVPGDPDAPTSNGGTPGWDPMCPPPPPQPCADPMDPTTCTDPCATDPASCGCSSNDPDCWPQPQEPACDAIGEMCEPGGPGGMTPENPPGDFGCDDIGTGGDTPTMPPPGDEPDDSGPRPGGDDPDDSGPTMPVPEEPNAP